MKQNGESFPVLNGIKHWVKVAGAEHHTIPLVVIHGGPGGNHYVFERTAGLLLEKQRTVVYYEQRGSGRSEPPLLPSEYSIALLVADLNALLAWLQVPQVDLLGYSFGGGLALEFALAHARKVRRLALQAPALRLHDPQIISSQLTGFRQVGQGQIQAEIQRILHENLSPAQQLDRVWEVVDTPTIDRFLFQDQEKAALNRALWQQNPAQNTGEMNLALNAQEPTTTSAHLHTLQHSTLILAGRHDRNVPLQMLTDMAGELPEAKLHIFEHSAHFPDIEETELYAQAVLDFLT